MGNEEEKKTPEHDECVVHTHPAPPSELERYSVDNDPHSEMDIARYVESQARDENVEHVYDAYYGAGRSVYAAA